MDDKGTVLTAMALARTWQRQEGTSLTVRAANGKCYPAREVISIDRHGGTALLRVPGLPPGPGLRVRARYQPGRGERMKVVMAATEEGVAKSFFPSVQAQDRKKRLISLSPSLPREAVGSPVFNGEGEIVGVMLSANQFRPFLHPAVLAPLLLDRTGGR